MGVTTDMFPAEEYGSGSRPTPLVDAPLWAKAQARREAGPEGERVSLTPEDRAFLESEPSYDEGAGLASLVPPVVVAAPSLMRRIVSLFLFATIAGGAGAVLVLAVMRMFGKTVFP